MRFSIISLFPEMVEAGLGGGVLGRARERGLVTLEVVSPRDFTNDRHRRVDDAPYGGGPGMVLMPGPLVAAIESVATQGSHSVLLSAAGRPFTQQVVERLCEYPHIVLICGRYEGVDQRVVDLAVDEELSVGDFVLTGGELAALLVVDAVSRYIPGVLGGAASTCEESFAAGLLEYPHYTRPAEFRGLAVPEVLRGGNHRSIASWRLAESLRRTGERRPDLLARRVFDEGEEGAWRTSSANWAARSHVILAHYPVLDRQSQVITTSLTNLDLHDIARATASYGLAGYWLITPITAQRDKIEGILSVWRRESYRGSRGQALARVKVASSIEEALMAIERTHAIRPHVVATSANPGPDRVGFEPLARQRALSPAPVAFLFGTGWGLSPEAISLADQMLVPVAGRSPYNHLSVRSAVAVILDRLFAAPLPPRS